MEGVGIKEIKRVIDAINVSRGVDFSNYAFSSFKRRIIRFIEINKIRDYNEFIDRIIADHVYADILIKEITVNVTEMFRDPTFWIVLRDAIFPQLVLKNRISIWHAACSTGEEVYSMAILLKESGLLKQSDIVATDLNSSVLKVAEKGVYSLKSQETNCKNYELFGGKNKLSDYYYVSENEVKYETQLIDNVSFIRHNLAQDGAISNFDLILCRNVLIYFNYELQERVIQTFGKSMLDGFFLGIGSKESISWCKMFRFFKPESFEEKIYRKVDVKEQIHHMNF